MRHGGLRNGILPAIALSAALWSDAGAQPAPPAPRPRAALPVVTVRFTTLGNLTYQLDCVSGVVRHCGTADFEALWRARFLRTRADTMALGQWRTARLKYTEAKPEPPATSHDEAPPLFGPTAGNRVEEGIRMAGFSARTRSAYTAALRPFVQPSDRGTLLAAIGHFEPRFAQWIRREARAHGDTFVRATTQWLTSAGRTSVQQLITLYDANVAARDTVVFTLLYRPGLAEAGSYGQALDRFALVEFLKGEQPADRIPVALHELAHVMSSRTRPATRARVQRAFVEQGDNGLAAYALLEEGLALSAATVPAERALRTDSAVQLLLRTPGTLYDTPEVDRAGRALVPLVQEWLSQGRRIDDATFAPRVVSALRAVFDTASDVRGLAAARNLLHMRTVFVDEGLGDEASRVRQEISSLFGAHFSLTAQDICCTADALAGFRAFPQLPSLLVVKNTNTDALAAALKLPAAALAATNGVEQPFIMVRTPEHPAPIFLIVARTVHDAQLAVRRLATAHSPLMQP